MEFHLAPSRISKKITCDADLVDRQRISHMAIFNALLGKRAELNGEKTGTQVPCLDRVACATPDDQVSQDAAP